MKLPDDVQTILDTLALGGYEGYVVGGCVRDYLMGNPPLDFDITTSATPDDMMRLFPKTVDTGANFGTITVVLNGENYELTTYRTETTYDNFRKPSQVAFSTDLNEDLKRRDFTMNAIAYHPSVGYVDPYGGQADIHHRLVKAVGDANERFTEDALRMLRCVRFAAKLDFKIDPQTYDALLTHRSLLSHISIERVREELTKTLLSNNIHKATILNETQLLYPIDKDLADYFARQLASATPYLSQAPKDLIIRLVILFKSHQNPKHVLTFLKFSNVHIKEVTKLIFYLNQMVSLTSRYDLKKCLLDLGTDTTDKYLTLVAIYGADITVARQLVSDILGSGEPLSLKDLAVDGHLLASHNIAGKQLGEVLKTLHDAVLKDPSKNTTEHLLTMANHLSRGY